MPDEQNPNNPSTVPAHETGAAPVSEGVPAHEQDPRVTEQPEMYGPQGHIPYMLAKQYAQEQAGMFQKFADHALFAAPNLSGKRVPEYLHLRSFGGPKDFRPPAVFGGAPVRTVTSGPDADLSEKARLYSPMMSIGSGFNTWNKPTEVLIPRFEGQTADEAIDEYRRKVQMSSYDLSRNLGMGTMATESMVSFGASSIATGGMERSAWQSAMEANPWDLEASQVLGEQVGFLMFPASAGGQTWHYVSTKAGQKMAGRVVPKLEALRRRATPLGPAVQETLVEGVPRTLGGEGAAFGAGTSMQEAVFRAMAEEGRQFNLFDWLLRRPLTNKALSKIRPDMMSGIQRMFDRVVGIGGRITGDGERVTIILPAGASPELVKNLHGALNLLKNSVGVTAQGYAFRATIRFAPTAGQAAEGELGAPVFTPGGHLAGMGFWAGTHAGATLINPHYSTEEKAAALGGMPSGALMIGALGALGMAEQLKGGFPPSYRRVRSGRILGQKGDVVDPFRKPGPEKAGPDVADYETRAPEPPIPGYEIQTATVMPRLLRAYKGSQNLSLMQDANKTLQGLDAMQRVAILGQISQGSYRGYTIQPNPDGSFFALRPDGTPLLPRMAGHEEVQAQIDLEHRTGIAQAHGASAQDPLEPLHTAVLARLNFLADIFFHPLISEASRLMGQDIKGTLTNPTVDPSWEAQFGEWARYFLALAEQARGLGDIIGNAPQPAGQTDLATIQGRAMEIAQNILEQNPSAAVGLPEDLANTTSQIPEPLLKAQPAQASLPPSLEFERENLNDFDFPGPEELTQDLSAYPQMQMLVDRALSSYPYPVPVAVIKPGNPSDWKALATGYDPLELIVYADRGLFKTRTLNATPDITRGLEPAVVPEEFGPPAIETDPGAPFVLAITEDGQIYVDAKASQHPDILHNREWFREETERLLGTGAKDPYDSPGGLLQVALNLTPDNPGPAREVLAQAQRLRERMIRDGGPRQEDIELRNAPEGHRYDQWQENERGYLQWLGVTYASEAIALDVLGGGRGEGLGYFLGTSLNNLTQSMREAPDLGSLPRDPQSALGAGMDTVVEFDHEGQPRMVQVFPTKISRAGRRAMSKLIDEGWAEIPTPQGAVIYQHPDSLPKLKATEEPTSTEIPGEKDIGPALLKVEGEGGTRAVAGMDPGILKVLGGNLYSGDLGKIAAKELLQNAVDSLRALPNPEEGKVTFHFEPDKRRITISDNGIGMSPDVATQQLVDIGGSYKPGQAASGGYGIAKVAIFSNADAIKIETSDGQTLTRLTGSADEWLDPQKGLAVESMPLAGTPNEGRTGTLITVDLKEEAKAEAYYTENFLRDFLGANRLPFTFDFKVGSADPTSAYPSELARKRGAKMMDTISGEGFEADIYVSDDTSRTTYPNFDILNNGLPQFSASTFLGNEMEFPKVVLVDVRPNAAPDQPNYPFRPDREGLRDAAKRKVDNYVTGTLARQAAERERNTYIDTISKAPKLPSGSLVIDTANTLPPEFVQEFAALPAIQDLDWMVSLIFDRVRAVLKARGGRGGVYDEVQYMGLSLAGDYLGMNIPGSYISADANRILVTPLAILEGLIKKVEAGEHPPDELPALFAEELHATVIHEFSHEIDRNHSEGFAGVLTRNLKAAFQPKVLDTVKQLTFQLEQKNGELLELLKSQLARATELRSEGEDPFSKIGTRRPSEGDRPGRGKGSANLGPGRGGRPGKGLSGSADRPPTELAPSARPRRGDADIAALKGDLWDYLAQGGGLSKSPWRRVFKILSPQEKFEAMKGRLSAPFSGETTKKGVSRERINHENLNPARYPLTYFGDWMPEPAQIQELTDLWEARGRRFATSQGTIAVLRRVAEDRARAHKRWIEKGDRSGLDRIDKKGLISMEDLLSIDEEQLLAAREESPGFFREFALQFQRQRASGVVAGEDAQVEEAFNSLQDVFSKLLEDDVARLPKEPTKEQRVAQRFQALAADGASARHGSLLWSRPWYTIGNYRQGGATPRGFKALVDSGMLEKDVYYILDQGERGLVDELAQLQKEQDFLRRGIDYDRKKDRKTGRETGPGVEASAYIHKALVLGLEKPSDLNKTWELKVTALPRTLRSYTFKAAEWVPKLRANLLSQLQRAGDVLVQEKGAEMAQLYRQVDAINQEIRARIEDYTQELTAAGKNVPSEKAILEELEKIDKGMTATHEPYEKASFRDLQKWKGIHTNAIKKLKQDSGELRRGKLLSQGAAYHKIAQTVTVIEEVKDEVRNVLATRSDPVLIEMQRKHPEKMSRFLQSRKGMDVPELEDWKFINDVFERGILRVIHLRPAVRRALEMSNHPDYPETQRQIVSEMANYLLGVPTTSEANMQAAWENDFRSQPSIRKALLSFIKGVDIDKALAEGKAGSREVARVGLKRMIIPLVLYHLNPIKISLANLTETAYALPHLAKTPLDRRLGLHASLWDITSGLVRTTGTRLAESASRTLNTLIATPDFYTSRATKAHTNDIFNIEASTLYGRLREVGKEAGISTGAQNFLDFYTTMSGMKATEKFPRTFLFDMFYRRARRLGVPEAEAEWHASQLAEHTQTGFRRTSWSPRTRGQVGSTLMAIQRFTASKTGQALSEARMGLESAVSAARPGREIEEWMDKDPVFPGGKGKKVEEAFSTGEDVAGRAEMDEDVGLPDEALEALRAGKDTPAPVGVFFDPHERAGRQAAAYLMAQYGVIMAILWPIMKHLYKFLGLNAKYSWEYAYPILGDSTALIQGVLDDGLTWLSLTAKSGAPGPDLTPQELRVKNRALARMLTTGVALELPGLSPIMGYVYRELYSPSVPPLQQGKAGGMPPQGGGGGPAPLGKPQGPPQ
jgi:anti-sigma regulatory factor (Ser/Thr protein kinase)